MLEALQPKDILTLTVSVAAFCISAVTYYYNVMRSVSLVLLPGDRINFNYPRHGNLSLHASMTFVNDGAKPGVVVLMVGEIQQVDRTRRTSVFDWRAFLASKNIGRPGQPMKSWFDFAGWVEPIIIPPRSAISKYLSFGTRTPFPLETGRYLITFRADYGEQRSSVISKRYIFEITESMSRFLDEQCRPNKDGINEHNLGVPLLPEAANDWTFPLVSNSDLRVMGIAPLRHFGQTSVEHSHREGEPPNP